MSRKHYSKKKGIISKETTEMSSFEGLTPDAETLSKMEEYCPGITERWMTLAEEEVRSRHTNEDKLVKAFSFSAIFGSISAFLISLVIAAVGCYAIYLGEAKVGAWIICGSMAQVITAILVRGRHKQ